MNDNFLLFTDLHLGKQNHNKVWEDISLKLFDNMILTCKQRGITKVICAGDFFDSRKNLSVLTIEAARYICEEYFEKNGIDLYLIRGNHDTFYKNQSKPHSLAFLSHYKHVHVIQYNPYFLEGMYLVPWEANMDEIPDDSFVIGHFEINGFTTNNSGNIQRNAKLSAKDFKRFKCVLSGHFHTPSTQNNIQYVGSAFPMDFNDVDSKRGYYVIDNYELEFIEFEDAPKFIKFTSESEFENVEGNNIKLTFIKDYGSVENEKILQKLNDMNPASLQIDYRISEEDEDLILEDEDFEVSDNPKVMRNYVKETTVPENINKDILVKFIEKLETEEV